MFPRLRDAREIRMTKRAFSWLYAVPLLAGLCVAAGANSAEASPTADEQCVLQCDDQSDQCMADAAGDDEKGKACDDKYAECLSQCK